MRSNTVVFASAQLETRSKPGSPLHSTSGHGMPSRLGQLRSLSSGKMGTLRRNNPLQDVLGVLCGVLNSGAGGSLQSLAREVDLLGLGCETAGQENRGDNKESERVRHEFKRIDKG